MGPVVLQQSETTWAHSDDDSDENDTELFGYEQLPQEEDDDDQLSESSEMDTDPIPVPIQYDTAEDTDISKGKVLGEVIRGFSGDLKNIFMLTK